MLPRECKALPHVLTLGLQQDESLMPWMQSTFTGAPSFSLPCPKFQIRLVLMFGVDVSTFPMLTWMQCATWLVHGQYFQVLQSSLHLPLPCLFVLKTKCEFPSFHESYVRIWIWVARALAKEYVQVRNTNKSGLNQADSTPAKTAMFTTWPQLCNTLQM